jgi:hypothetical protein
LLDAINLLPEVGPSIDLAMTALEVFGSRILNLLAEKSPIPQELWSWINNRGGELGWFREPGTDEQFYILLRILIGVSLKDDNRLWEAFTHLRQARNSFVHEGLVQIKGQVLTIEDVRQLVYAAFDIIRFIRERLPEDVKWPEYRHNFNVQASIKLLGE